MATGTNAGLLNERPAQSLFKHRVLNRYLRPCAAMTGSTANRNRVVILDGYAGKGRYPNGDPASAELMLQLARESSANVELMLVEQNENHFKQLESVVTEYTDQGVKAQALHGTVEDYLEMAVEYAKGVPLFLFLDPTGAMLPYEQLERILTGPRGKQWPATEVLLNFSAKLSQRTAGQLLGSPGPDGTYTLMDSACGGSWWKDIALEVLERNPSNFEPVAEAIVQEYTKRFSDPTGMTGISVPVQAKVNHQPVYHLVFLTRSPYGLWVMGDAIARARNDWLQAIGPQDENEEGALIPYAVSAKERINADQAKAQAVVAENLSAEAEHWHLLLQVVCDDRTNMEWGDAGALYWQIRTDDLAAKRFDRAYFT